ncbi:MAG TPA: PKD domain-containing protein [Thermoplasmata archaeon]|nr:PKD domain-containing protein [Thermoplasmata archaeon]
MRPTDRSAPQLATVAAITLVLGLSALAAVLAPGLSVAVPAPTRATHASASAGSLELAVAHASLRAPVADHSHPEVPTPAAPPLLSPGGFEWSDLTAQLSVAPSPRTAESIAWDPADGYALMFGGENSASVVLSDTWSFSNGTWTNLTAGITGAPPPLLVAGLAYDPSDHEMVLFGGQNHTGVVLTQTWAYHARTWTNLTGTTGATPPAGLLSGMATDTAASDVVLFGGQSPASGAWGTDTWTFKAGTWTNITASANAPAGHLFYPTASDDPAIAGVSLYAVYPAGTGIDAATLQFTGGSWHNLSGVVSGDSGSLILAEGGYLAPLGAVAEVSTEIWNASFSTTFGVHTAEYSNQTWTNVTSPAGGPPDLGILAGVGDLPNDLGLLGFGGITVAGISGQTWVLTAPPQVSLQVAHVVTDANVSDAFTSVVTGGFGPLTYHWNFGDGASSSAASASAHAYARAGKYLANLTVVDSVGHSVTASLYVVVDSALTAQASSSPSPATAGAAVALVGTFSGGTGPYTFAWTLGDLNTSTAPSLAHVYGRAGNFSVSFTVTDALGQTATQSFTLQVKAPAPTSSGSSSVSLTSGVGLDLLLGIVLLAIVAVILGALLARRPKSPPGPPAPYPAAAGPAGYGAPPPPPPGAA